MRPRFRPFAPKWAFTCPFTNNTFVFGRSFSCFYQPPGGNADDIAGTAVAGQIFSIQLGSAAVGIKSPNLRQSWKSKRPVVEILADALPNTLLLAVVSILFAMIAGVVVGALVAMADSQLLNKLVLIITVFGMSLPSFLQLSSLHGFLLFYWPTIPV